MTDKHQCDAMVERHACDIEGPGNSRRCHEAYYGVSHPDFEGGRIYCQCSCHGPRHRTEYAR